MKISGKYLVVLACMCGLLASGIGLVTNVSGLFFTSVAEEFGILKGEVSLTLTIANISLALGGLLVPRLLSERSLRPLLIGSTAALAGSTAALAVCSSIIPMYILSAVRGLAAGLTTFVFATTVLNRWFVSNIGLATSIAMGCSGLAGALFSPIVSSIISSAGWRTGFVMLAILTIALNLPAILFVPALDPSSVGLTALGARRNTKHGTSQERKGADNGRNTPINPVIFAAVIVYALFVSAVTAMPQHFPGLATAYALDAATGAAMLSACMVANTAGKVVLGALVDRIGTKPSILFFTALTFAATVMLLMLRSPGVLLVAATVYGLCYALATVGIAMLTRDAFGLANYDRTYPTASFTGNIANAVFSSIVGFMFDFTGGYTSSLVLFMVMLASVVVLVLFIYISHDKQAVQRVAS